MAHPRLQPSPRAARKSEWLRSALAHHHCPDPGAENEIVVLATGIDQYLQEVFHHLAHPHQDDTVSAEDFTTLCAVLGLPGAQRTLSAEDGNGDGGTEEQHEEFRNVCLKLPDQLSFKEFHSRLCGCFRLRSAHKTTGDRNWRLPVSEDTELVERQIRLRWPRVRRRKCVSFDLNRDQTGTSSRSLKSRTEVELHEQDEVVALRELVEDLRSALQGSDARCLALEVALRREKGCTITAPYNHSASVSAPRSFSTLMQEKLVQTDRLKGQPGDRTRKGQRGWDIRDPLLRELKLIRSSRDGQLEEAIKYSRHLEEELQWAYQEVRKLQAVQSSLRRDNSQIRRRAEEAREALTLGLERVRLIQEQAQSVPQLHSKITKLETELLRYRISCTCLSENQLSQAEDLCEAEGLQRAVEGRAASDEEEDDRALKNRGQCFSFEEKSNLSPNRDLDEGCLKKTAYHLLTSYCLEHKRHPSAPTENNECCSWMAPKQEKKNGCGGSGNIKTPEDEAERTRLSLLEDKLTDSLTLLLQLRNKNLSNRALEKIVMDSLGVCSKSKAGPAPGPQAADALCIHLASSDLPRGRGEEDKQGGQSAEKDLHPLSGCQTNNNNSLLISG